MFYPAFTSPLSQSFAFVQASKNRPKQAACHADARAEIQSSTSTPDRANRRLS
jgi:hypothetical protein